MTYNVRRCTGIDGRVSPDRIAAVINSYQPDVVALQEVDVNRKRTGNENQPERLAALTGMKAIFFARLVKDDERYGIAVLSKHPMDIMRVDRLHAPETPEGEVTGAIWVQVNAGGKSFQLIATHFAHIFKDRYLNIRALVGKDWIGDPRCRPPIVFCGDMNTTYRSPVYAHVHAVLKDAQEVIGRYKKTWPSIYPVMRIDHIFISKNVGVTKIRAPWNFRNAFASDHLPLIADLSF